MRKVMISSRIVNRLSDIKNYLKNELKMSQKAALVHNDRFFVFMDSLRVEVDYPLCRFKKWRALGYRCAVFEKQRVLAYEVTARGVIVQDMSHTALLKE